MYAIKSSFFNSLLLIVMKIKKSFCKKRLNQDLEMKNLVIEALNKTSFFLIAECSSFLALQMKKIEDDIYT